MAASSRAQVLRLYRALLRESQRFSGYSYRTYAIRRIKDAFRENKNLADSEKIEELVNKAKANLEVIQRQSCEHLMFCTDEGCLKDRRRTSFLVSNSAWQYVTSNKANAECKLPHGKELPLASCMPQKNWSLRVRETHSQEKSLILKQHWTIFSILQCHIQKLHMHISEFVCSA
ncbi:LYR motif-containing protein 4 isoform X1 [Pyrgilauda ruficollis]|uniref:LYR motif-containing protein 4 isoform X1 n=1 Tax=Pyrgilauda ruficollis TaxID=221976 RepID=UPI001B86793A|nr:LYR motif-containing protein 4 isoform X1 [Pyrgilauda ruficollis]